jgi:hypothetical protein
MKMFLGKALHTDKHEGIDFFIWKSMLNKFWLFLASIT